MNEVWTWILNFTGVNNGDNSFATHMYNFWSGFGGNVSIVALIATLIAIYRRSSNKLHKLQSIMNPLHFVRNIEQEIDSSHSDTKK